MHLVRAPQGLTAIWKYRHFVLAAITGELKNRFARSRLGAFWLILQPLAQAAIFALVLSEVLMARLPGVDDKSTYAAYLMAGLAAWGLFAEVVNRCTTIFIEYSNAMKKIAFPRLCLPIVVVGSALVNHALLLLAIFIILGLFGHAPRATWAALPVGLALAVGFGFGLGIIVGTLNTFSRDVAQVTAIVLQFWFWLTPIVYSVEALPANLRWIIGVNPFTPVVRTYQDTLVFNRWPDWSTLFLPALLALAMMIAALVLFRRASADLVDAL